MPIQLTPIPPSDTYGSRAGIEGIYGVFNVAAWASLEGQLDDAGTAAQIDRARLYSYSVIASYRRGGGLTAVATADNSTEFPLYPFIEDELSGAWLYQNRGTADQTSERDGQMQAHWDHAISELQRVIGVEQANATEVAGGTDGITVIGCPTNGGWGVIL